MSGSELFQRIDLLFHPRSIAVVGVSKKMGNMGLGYMIALKSQGFEGRLYAINPRAEVPGFETHKSMGEVPGPVDHVIVCIPAAAVPAVIQECVDKQVRSVSIFSSGFREWGTEEGLRLEEEIIRIARQGGVRVIGPNCMGFYCPRSGLSFRADMPALKNGRISMISQSGGVSMTPVFSAAEKGIGFAKSISYGNESDFGAVDSLLYLSEDPDTEVICVYIEGTRHGDDFRGALREAAEKKPVLVVKGGRTLSGNRAVQSHTGAMAGTSMTWEALCRQTRAILVDNLEEMLDTARLLILAPRPRGKRLALISISGGLGVLYTDLFARAGLEVPEFRPSLKEELRKYVGHPGTSIRNPLDMAVSFFEIQNYRSIFHSLDQDPDLDIIGLVLAMEYLAFFNEQAEKWSRFFVDKILEVLGEVHKPVVVVFPETFAADLRLKLEKHMTESGFAVFPTAERCTRALNNVLSLKGEGQ